MKFDEIQDFGRKITLDKRTGEKIIKPDELKLIKQYNLLNGIYNIKYDGGLKELEVYQIKN